MHGSRPALLAAGIALAMILPPAPAIGGHGFGYDYGVHHRYERRQAAPRVVPPSYSRALSLFQLRDYDATRRELRALVETGPGDADAWTLLGLASLRLRDYTGAEDYYAEALRLDPGHRGALQYQGELYITQRRYEAAKANLARLEELCGGCAERDELDRALVRAGQSPESAPLLRAPGDAAAGVRRLELPEAPSDGPRRLKAPGGGS
ncbi:tetratricopeptide repeat protein [Defluviimonas sp. WL0024]|uniref:Tetratricopeptide repeat protein n=1 Tax=Albidovulum salinarum TaxID=2984153 RepID=A0ABT2X3N1_9RHOB|nr:tetratricopeptide repeat protein [Defluviimonas sp. WL0024]MCU9848329.1 tetratricopeptide repeat protein [Defluviimonas sp. WL0024]